MIAVKAILYPIYTWWLISSWYDENNIIPEEQAGLRKGRRGLGNLFSLSSIINTSFIESKPLFCILIDFQRAFDSDNHRMLCQKIFRMGISRKIIRKLKDIQKLVIYIDNFYLSPIEITEGILQGDCLNLCLFSLFLSDITQFFKDKNMPG